MPPRPLQAAFPPALTCGALQETFSTLLVFPGKLLSETAQRLEEGQAQMGKARQDTEASQWQGKGSVCNGLGCAIFAILLLRCWERTQTSLEHPSTVLLDPRLWKRVEVLIPGLLIWTWRQEITATAPVQLVTSKDFSQTFVLHL